MMLISTTRYVFAGALPVVFCVALAACASDGSAASNGGSPDGSTPSGTAPCDLATKADVESAFGATAAEGKPGVTPRSCEFVLSDVPVDSVHVYLYSTNAAVEANGIRQGYVDNRGGVTDVPGIGDSAYTPNDNTNYELVVQKRNVVFGVQTIDITQPRENDPSSKIRALAVTIAGRL